VTHVEAAVVRQPDAACTSNSEFAREGSQGSLHRRKVGWAGAENRQILRFTRRCRESNAISEVLLVQPSAQLPGEKPAEGIRARRYLCAAQSAKHLGILSIDVLGADGPLQDPGKVEAAKDAIEQGPFRVLRGESDATKHIHGQSRERP